MTELLCPNCGQPLELGEAESFDFIFMGRAECQECGASVFVRVSVAKGFRLQTKRC